MLIKSTLLKNLMSFFKNKIFRQNKIIYKSLKVFVSKKIEIVLQNFF